MQVSRDIRVYMKTLHVVTALVMSVLAMNGQDKTMHVQNQDGTYASTRVAELAKISFISVADQGKGMIISSTTSAPVKMLFEERPEVTVSGSKIVFTTQSSTPLEMEMSDITDIRFGEAASLTATEQNEGIECVLGAGSATFRGVACDATVAIYTVDGRRVAAPSVSGGEMTLSRNTLEAGIYIVHIGNFTTKITL